MSIGFDLDMTLVDSAAAIVDAVAFTCASYGVTVDEAAIAATVGLPLDQVFPDWLPGVDYAEALTIYRGRYLSHGVAMSRALPGAHESLVAVLTAGGTVVVVSAKHETHVRAVLVAVGLDEYVAHVEGELFGAAKGEALLRHRASAYVGDHPGDVAGAHAAGAVAVAVPTGPTSGEVLGALLEGADVLLPDLTHFPAWLDGHLNSRDAAT